MSKIHVYIFFARL